MRPATPLCSVFCHAGPSTRRAINRPQSKPFSTTRTRNPRSQGHYEALKIPRNATRQQVKAKFYELSKQFHPDSPGGGSAERFHEINDAYGVLGDDNKRQKYDRSLDSSSNWGGPQNTRQGGSAYGTYPSSSPTFTQTYSHSRPPPSGPHRAWSNPSSTSSSSSSATSNRSSTFDFPNNLRYGPSGSSGGYGGPSSHQSTIDPFATLSSAARNAWKQDYKAQKARHGDRDGDRLGEGGQGANPGSALGSVLLIMALLGGIMVATRGVGTSLAGEQDWRGYPAEIEWKSRRGGKSSIGDEEGG